MIHGDATGDDTTGEADAVPGGDTDGKTGGGADGADATDGRSTDEGTPNGGNAEEDDTDGAAGGGTAFHAPEVTGAGRCPGIHSPPPSPSTASNRVDPDDELDESGTGAAGAASRPRSVSRPNTPAMLGSPLRPATGPGGTRFRPRTRATVAWCRPGTRRGGEVTWVGEADDVGALGVAVGASGTDWASEVIEVTGVPTSAGGPVGVGIGIGRA